MDTVNSNTPETTPAPVASVPEVTPVPGATPVVAAAPAPAETVKGELPKTTGKTPGGWNRFAGFNRADQNKKQRDGGRGGSGRR
jgi:hypothetical protein